MKTLADLPSFTCLDATIKSMATRAIRLATLSSSQVYNIRENAAYRTRRVVFTKTRPVANKIGVHRAPRPEGRAGFVHIDSVHQVDLDSIKGMYYITCVDAVSQWQIEACVEAMSEAYLLPVLAAIRAQFPFELLGFHSDNGSEYINYKVAQLLDKLRVKQAKSGSCLSNDNALAESKNASVVRKHVGYDHIPQKYAKPINTFFEQTFNQWLNLHRPCMYATEQVNTRGKIVKRCKHRDAKTPLECLQIVDAKGLVAFKVGITTASLIALARSETDLVQCKRCCIKRAVYLMPSQPKNDVRR